MDKGSRLHCADFHCPHQEHWAKELSTVALRTEQYLHRKLEQFGGASPIKDNEPEESDKMCYVTTSDEICALFNGLHENAGRRAEIVKKASSEVTKNKKKSIKRILLTIAPSTAWMNFSKKGQRGKHSAIEMGLDIFLVDCLNRSMVSCVV